MNLTSKLSELLRLLFLVFLILIFLFSLNAQPKPIAHFSFDDIRVERKIVEMVRGETYVPKEVFAYVNESSSGLEYDLEGKYYKVVEGVVGKAALLDGYTAHMQLQEVWEYNEATDEERIVKPIPRVERAFTIEGWLALGAYPKNVVPIWSQRKDESEGSYEGYSLEIDAWGRLLLKVATKNGKTESLLADETIPLDKWTYVAATYSPETGMSIYMDGELKTSRTFKGEFNINVGYESIPILIAKSRVEMRPTGTIRPEGTERSFTYLDGILDELKVYNVALDAKTIAKIYNKTKATESPELPERVLPSGPQSPGIFRAVNTTLDYYPGWDAPWAVGDHADVVVQFDESDCKFVFWRGTSYIPSWVSENGIHFNNGFNEGWNEHGSCEPMSDKKTKYSTVKIVESNEARVVVKWRYALVDVTGKFAFEDPETGWGDWTNETYYIYPDMTAVREDKLLSNAPHAAHEWQESMMVLSPGQDPEDVLEYAALTVANIEGDSKTYSWENQTPPGWPEEPKNINTQLVNTKANYKPFSGIRPQDIQGMDIYAGEVRREVSVFPWWNHWPVAPRPTDGRYANFADRAAHSSLSHWFWDAYKSDDRSMTKIMLCGLTNKDINEIIKLNRSWSSPAEIEVAPDIPAEYRPEEKAYNLKAGEEISGISMTLKGSEDSPVVNPAFVIEDWGQEDIELKIDDQVMQKNKDARWGYRNSVSGVDLVIWVRIDKSSDVSISINRK